ncbi:PREDICTED: adenosine deaminase CECR1-like [Dufourea novaeangliae]|uniref:adenosine deaminase CECR1-like n=1 Tax=Dufourea novaeangliae TaxID=178035 RepID=UPI000767543A|nr:PREDICTED: adenosine deaminase CECR1-like [Dufourea novaeangliae]
MKGSVLSLTVLLGLACVTIAMPRITYKSLRTQILEYEERMMLGGSLSLNHDERAANDVLMHAKRKELEHGFKDLKKFAPGWSFLSAKKDIDKSKIFHFLRRMPKGAVLHAHDTSMVSTDYIFQNITYRDNLYVCEIDGTVKLQFFEKPPNETSCHWELLKDVRKHPDRAKNVDKKIKNGMSMVCSDPNETYPDLTKAWKKFSDIFGFMKPIVTFRPVYEDHFLRALEELYEDNVMYLELRSTLPTLYDFDGTKYGPKNVVGIYKNLADRFKKDHPDFVGVKLIYAPQRFVDHKRAEDYIKILKELQELYPDFVAGFDLVGQEDNGNTLEYFADMLEKIEPTTKFFFHAGETNWYGTSTDENLVDAILMNTRRIGHGYALTYHPFLLEMTKRMDIAIEVNPISNQVLKLVDDLRNHAARRLFAEGYPIVISNDDPGFWGARALSYDFYEAFMALMSEHSDLRGLKQLAMNSLIYSSLNEQDTKAALLLWEKKWNHFVKDMVKERF